MPEIERECEEEVECPKCGYKFTWSFTAIVEFDMGDFAPDWP